MLTGSWHLPPRYQLAAAEQRVIFAGITQTWCVVGRPVNPAPTSAPPRSHNPGPSDARLSAKRKSARGGVTLIGPPSAPKAPRLAGGGVPRPVIN